MANEIKRVRYFDRMFLKKEDFIDDQQYHINMRRLHNELLHTPGIAEGLDVSLLEETVNRKKIKFIRVTIGTAIDRRGYDLVLTTDYKKNLEEVLKQIETYEKVQAGNIKEFSIYIKYDKYQAERGKEQVLQEEYTRFYEVPSFIFTTKGFDDIKDYEKDRWIFLAKVKNESGSWNVHTDGRVKAGTKVTGSNMNFDNLTVSKLIFKSEVTEEKNWPAIEAGTGERVLNAFAPLKVQYTDDLPGLSVYNSNCKATTKLKLGQNDKSTIEVGFIGSSAGANANTAFIASTGDSNPLALNNMGIGPITFNTSNWQERMRITTDGKVGIGTNAPQAKLQVCGGAIRPENGKDGGIVFVNTGNPGDNSDFAYIQYHHLGNETTQLRIGVESDSIDSIGFFHSSTECMTIKNKNVGIGASDPQSKLHVNYGDVTIENGTLKMANKHILLANGSQGGLLFQNTANGQDFTDHAYIRYEYSGDEVTKLKIGVENDGEDSISFYHYKTECLTIKNANVGIGNSDPKTKLHVNSGDVTIENGILKMVNKHILLANGNNGGLLFQNTANGADNSDHAYITYDNLGYENTKLKIGVQNDDYDSIGFFHKNKEIMTIWNGCVGIGTSQPGSLLHLYQGNALLEKGSLCIKNQSYAKFELMGVDNNGRSNSWAIYGAANTASDGISDGAFEIWGYPNGTPMCNLRIASNGDTHLSPSGFNVQAMGGTNRLIIGNAWGPFMGFGTTYLGFNAKREGGKSIKIKWDGDNKTYPSHMWNFSSDGCNNGGMIVYGDIFGGLHIVSKPTRATAQNPGLGQKEDLIYDHILFGGAYHIMRIDPNGSVHINGELYANGKRLA